MAKMLMIVTVNIIKLCDSRLYWVTIYMQQGSVYHKFALTDIALITNALVAACAYILLESPIPDVNTTNMQL